MNSTCISLIMILEDPRKHQSLPSDLNIQYKSIYTIMISPVAVLVNARQFHTFNLNKKIKELHYLSRSMNAFFGLVLI